MATTSKKTLICGILAGIAIIIIGVLGYLKIGEGEPGSSDNNGDNDNTKIEKTIKDEDTRKPVPESAVNRIVPRVIKAQFDLTGCGESGNWGVSGIANFKYTIIVVAESQIDSKEVLPGGEIKVTEIRTFKTVQDSLVISDVDMKLDVSLLPVDEFSRAIDWAVRGWEAFTGDVVTGETVTLGKKYLKKVLQKIDGMSVRSLVGACGLSPSQDVERQINQMVQSAVLKMYGGVRSISNKSYKIIYYQKSSGEPLYVKFTYSDGKPVTENDEKRVLRRVNAFIDYNLVPNKDCVPGQSWNINAADMQEAFDPYADGSYVGTVKATRKANNEKGEWVVALSPSTIDIINDSNNTTGHMNLVHGVAIVNPELVSLYELSVGGTAQGQQVNRHHLLFKAKLAGECDFSGKMVTTVMNND